MEFSIMNNTELKLQNLKKAQQSSHLDQDAIAQNGRSELEELSLLYKILIHRLKDKVISNDYRRGELRELSCAIETVGEQILLFKQEERRSRLLEELEEVE